jgi:hypothetical protein
MGLFLDDPKPFALGQSVTWMCETPNGSVVPVQVKVVNVIDDRVMIRIVKRPAGAVYFKVVDEGQLHFISSSAEYQPG